jgi:hypothetical protein
LVAIKRRLKVESGFYLGLGALALLWTSSALADARAEYKGGLSELEAQDFGAAARHFRSAIAERGEERHHLLAARRYYPHYYLGVVLTEQQNCRAGMRSLSESKNQGKIQRSEELLADLERRMSSCQEHLAAVEEAYREAEGLLTEGDEAGETLGNLSSRSALVPLWSGDERGLGRRQSQALDQLRALRQLASTARQAGDVTALKEAKEGAIGALNSLRSLIAEARRELGDFNAATASALEQVEQGAAQARRTLRDVRDLAPYPPRLAEKIRTVEQLLAEADGLEEKGQATEFGALRANLAEARKQVLTAARRPPRRLVEAVETFLRGEYQATSDLLIDKEFKEERANAHSCILQAASLHGLHVLGGERDQERRFGALQAARACAEVNPPRSTRYLSPRFLGFYEDALALSEDEVAAISTSISTTLATTDFTTNATAEPGLTTTESASGSVDREGFTEVP